MSQARDYLSKPPRRLPVSFRTYVDAAKKSIATFIVLLHHTLSAYGTAPPPEQSITTNSPKGTLRPKLLQRIEKLWEAARTRSEHLEQKSTATLSGLGIAAPIVIALSAFIVKQPSISAWVRYTSLLLVALAIASMVMGFLAILRALSVREREELGIDSVVVSRAFRRATDDFHGRGLLYVYIKQQALNDHVANFIRASQMFLAISVALVLLAGAVVVPGIAAAAGRQQSAPEPALSQLNKTLETLIDQVDHTEVLRAEQLRMRKDLGKLRFEIQRLSANHVRNPSTALPADRDPETPVTSKRAEPSTQP
ncbi:hypothetical protein ABQF04_11235 [Xanthomonas campestris pv. campestris]|uniref:hypothetical protein n=1 Tax=Xanthomonas campestris TaxID=339 RepID=UPI001E5B3599|nr:hypothetical protein [Xanthomonas campestris]MCC5067076.1 hypothetical protein [Xanthomonas campestris]MEB2230970.1 hypothetical protein [Xanthomonas campestris pv. campestris]